MKMTSLNKVVEVQAVFSDNSIEGGIKEIDMARFAKNISDAVKRLNKEGCEIVEIVPVLSGFGMHATGGGHSYTEGVIILGRYII